MIRRRAGQATFAGVVLLSLVMLFSPASDVPSGLQVNDKLVHLLLFVALAASGRMAGVAALPLAVALAAYAGLSELLQDLLPINRDGDPRDLLADLGGILVGLVLVAVGEGARSRGDRRVDA